MTVVTAGMAPSGLANASSRKLRRDWFVMRSLLPKPNANKGASAAGVVGGLIAFNVGCNEGGEPAGAVGGVLLNKPVCGNFPPGAIRV